MSSPGRFDDLPRLQRLALAARRAGGGILALPPPRIPVGGTEPTGYRDYSSGYDWRHVDWNVCARHDELRVRLFGGRPDDHVGLLLDGSASMALGQPRTRFEVAARVASALGFVALDRGARLSVCVTSDRLERIIGPVRGKGRAGVLLRAIGAIRPGNARTDFRCAAEAFLRVYTGSGPVVVISDFSNVEPFLAGVEVLFRAGLPVRVVHVHDPTQTDQVTPGDVELVDCETGEVWQTTLTPSQLRRYRQLLEAEAEMPRRCCAKFGIPYARVGLDEPDEFVLWSVIRTRSLAR